MWVKVRLMCFVGLASKIATYAEILDPLNVDSKQSL